LCLRLEIEVAGNPVHRRRTAGDDGHVVRTGEARNDGLRRRGKSALHETCDVRHDPLIKGVLEIGGSAPRVADDNERTGGKAIAHSIDIDGFLACHDRASEVVSMAQSNDVIKAYWQPGCTSCLRMKEFLTKHGVPFVSINVLEDKQGFAELAELGIRTVPIVRR